MYAKIYRIPLMKFDEMIFQSNQLRYHCALHSATHDFGTSEIWNFTFVCKLQLMQTLNIIHSQDHHHFNGVQLYSCTLNGTLVNLYLHNCHVNKMLINVIIAISIDSPFPTTYIQFPRWNPRWM